MRQAVILAAGEGKRLRPFTVNKPKVMLSVAGRPILSYVIEALTGVGIRDIVIIAGYRKEQVFNYFGSGEACGASITYVNQEKQVGTASALAQAKSVTEGEFLVLPGDNLITRETIAGFVNTPPHAVLTKRVENPRRYGVITLSGNLVKSIVEKPREARSNIVSTGIYALSRDIFDFIGDRLDIPDVINGMIEKGYPVKAVETDATWLDAVYPWDLISISDAILSRIPDILAGTIEGNVAVSPPVSIGGGTLIRSGSYLSGPVIIGSNCEIGPSTVIIGATSIGDNTVIAPFCHIKNSIIGSDVTIGPGCIIEDSVIDKGTEIKGRFTAMRGVADIKVDDEHHEVDVGAMIGEDCNIEAGVVALPGVIVGNLCHIGPLKVISGHLPDKSLVV